MGMHIHFKDPSISRDILNSCLAGNKLSRHESKMSPRIQWDVKKRPMMVYVRPGKKPKCNSLEILFPLTTIHVWYFASLKKKVKISVAYLLHSSTVIYILTTIPYLRLQFSGAKSGEVIHGFGKWRSYLAGSNLRCFWPRQHLFTGGLFTLKVMSAMTCWYLYKCVIPLSQTIDVVYFQTAIFEAL